MTEPEAPNTLRNRGLDGRPAPRLEGEEARDESGHDEQHPRHVDRHGRGEVRVECDDGCLQVSRKRKQVSLVQFTRPPPRPHTHQRH